MKKYLLAIVACFLCIPAFAGDRDHITLNAGFLFPYTLNTNIGYEHETINGNAWEVYGELGDHWQRPACHMFWKGYFWDGGGVYKHKLKRLKNGSFRVFGGAHCGADRKHFFFGIRAGFEYNYVFPNNWEFSITQLNTVNFLHGDVFRNGILLGLKFPL